MSVRVLTTTLSLRQLSLWQLSPREQSSAVWTASVTSSQQLDSQHAAADDDEIKWASETTLELSCSTSDKLVSCDSFDTVSIDKFASDVSADAVSSVSVSMAAGISVAGSVVVVVTEPVWIWGITDAVGFADDGRTGALLVLDDRNLVMSECSRVADSSHCTQQQQTVIIKHVQTRDTAGAHYTVRMWMRETVNAQDCECARLNAWDCKCVRLNARDCKCTRLWMCDWWC